MSVRNEELFFMSKYWIVCENIDSADLILPYHHLTRLALVPSPLHTSQCVLGSLPPPPLRPGVGVEEVDAVEVDADGVGDGECKPLPFNLSGRLVGGGADEPGRGEER